MASASTAGRRDTFHEGFQQLASGLEPQLESEIGSQVAKTREAAAFRAAIETRDLVVATRFACRGPAIATPWLAAALLLLSTASAAQNSALSRFAQGLAALDGKDYAAAVQDLKGADLPKLQDYVAYYLAAAEISLKDFAGAAHRLAAFPPDSPLTPKAGVLMAQALTGAGSSDRAIQYLRENYSSLPQPDGDFTLATAYEAARDMRNAATYYQSVYFHFPATEAAARASDSLKALRDTMAASYPQASPEEILDRGEKWMLAREYAKARMEFELMAPRLTGLYRDLARVRAGRAWYAEGDVASAYRYLKVLEVEPSGAAAERLYWLTECARRLGEDSEILSFTAELDKHYPQSPWRLKALVAAGNRFLVLHQPEKYEPLFRAAYQSFPEEPLGIYCQWRIAWSDYMSRRPEAAQSLRNFLAQHPSGAKASAALYFMGRLAEADSDYASARAWYEKITAVFANHYYAILADARLKQPKVVAAHASPEVAQFLSTIPFPERKLLNGQIPTPATSRRMERAHLLASAGRDDLAREELRFGANADGQPYLLAMEAARIATSPHLGLRSIKSMAPDYLSIRFEAAPRRFWELLFPLPWQKELVRSAIRRNLEPWMIAALIRQESEFNPAAVSRANAYGLTQILPATGRQIARRDGVRHFRASMLFQPEISLRLGASHLRSVLDQWNGNWEQALAAYNAGASRVQEWLARGPYVDPAEFVESIPFTETREYVQSVLRNAAMYRRIYGTPVRGAGSQAPVRPVAPRHVRQRTNSASNLEWRVFGPPSADIHRKGVPNG